MKIYNNLILKYILTENYEVDWMYNLQFYMKLRLIFSIILKLNFSQKTLRLKIYINRLNYKIT